MDPAKLLTFTQMLVFITRDSCLSDQEFYRLVLRNPSRFLHALGSLKSRRITGLFQHKFVCSGDRVEIPLKVNMLVKLILSLNSFKGSYNQAKKLTNLLIEFGCDFTINDEGHRAFRQLILNNIAVSLCSSVYRFHWKPKFVYFLTKRPGFEEFKFIALADFMCGGALTHMRHIDNQKLITFAGLRRFAHTMLITGRFPRFSERMMTACIEAMDSSSLELLHSLGYDLNKVLRSHFRCEDLKSIILNITSDTPRLLFFLESRDLFNKPLSLQAVVRISLFKKYSSELRPIAKWLKENLWITKIIYEYLLFKEFKP